MRLYLYSQVHDYIKTPLLFNCHRVRPDDPANLCTMASKIRSKDFKPFQIYSNKTISIAISILKKHYKHNTKEEKMKLIRKIKGSPEKYIDHEQLSVLAQEFIIPEEQEDVAIELRKEEVELHVFGRPIIKSNAYEQMKTAMKLPIAEKAALMPDSHLGYGLPIGGVLATNNAVIPFAIGMDIGCRMSLTLYEVTERFFKKKEHQFKQSIISNTAFGVSKTIEFSQEHEFLDQDVFNTTPLLKRLKSKAARQLGSSGSGNHFVEWGIVEMKKDEVVDLPEGKYIGLLAHSGSRGFGASIAKYYADMARNESNLPHSLRHLAWLDMNENSGQEYWMSMNLAGSYASACHDQIHKNVSKAMGLKAICKIENHHNFAWKEEVSGKELIVHRKGATPAGKDVLGIIPGSMTDPGFIVKGKGNVDAIASASHGAGRKHSRKETISRNTKSDMRKHLIQKNVTLIGGALDESPYAYKNLERVMTYQKELVETVGKFTPRLVRMDRDK